MAYFGEAYMGRRRRSGSALSPMSRLRQTAHGTAERSTRKRSKAKTWLVMATFPTLDSIACTINASRLIDTYGEQAAYQQRTINKVAGQGTMIKITIPIYEVTA